MVLNDPLVHIYHDLVSDNEIEQMKREAKSLFKSGQTYSTTEKKIVQVCFQNCIFIQFTIMSLHW